MGKCKTKAIYADLGIFTHLLAYPGIFRHMQTYSEIIKAIFWSLDNPGKFKTPVYSEFWHIQNQRHIQNPVISKTLAHSELKTYSESWAIQTLAFSVPEAYSEPCQICTMERFESQLTAIIIFTSYNSFSNINFSIDISSSIRHRFDLEFPRRNFVDISSIMKGEFT